MSVRHMVGTLERARAALERVGEHAIAADLAFLVEEILTQEAAWRVSASPRRHAEQWRQLGLFD